MFSFKNQELADTYQEQQDENEEGVSTPGYFYCGLCGDVPEEKFMEHINASYQHTTKQEEN